MKPFAELLGSNKENTFNFFLYGLGEVTGRKSESDRELMYVTSILAHFAGTPCSSKYRPFVTPTDFRVVVDNFVLGSIAFYDSHCLADGGAKTLFLAGFFRSQMAGRHNVNWCDSVGSSLFRRAASVSSSRREAILFEGLSHSFTYWTFVCSELQKHLHESRLMIKSL